MDLMVAVKQHSALFPLLSKYMTKSIERQTTEIGLRSLVIEYKKTGCSFTSLFVLCRGNDTPNEEYPYHTEAARMDC